MKIQIDRDLAIPIYTQIVGQIQFGIVSGHLPFGAQLPSIRDLAKELNVAAMTITQAYQELKQLGMIEMRPGLGTFVADFPVQASTPQMPNKPLQLRRMLQRAVAEAKNAGFVEEDIRQTFMALLSDSNGLFANRYLVLVGLFPRAMQVYADDLERELAADRVVVEPISFDDLRACPACYAPELGHAEALLVPLHQIHMLQETLKAAGLEGKHPILGLSFSLRPSTCEAIAALPVNMRIGIVSCFPEFANTMLQGISAVHPLQQGVELCLSAERNCLRQLVQSVQAIVYASGSEEAVDDLRPLVPPGFPFIEYLHTPNRSTYTRIRQLLAMKESSPPKPLAAPVADPLAGHTAIC